MYFDANLDTSLPLYIGQVTEWTYYTTTSIHWTMDRMGMLYHYQYYIGQWTEWTYYTTTSIHWTMDGMDMLYHYQYALDNGQNGHVIPLPLYIGQWTEWTCYTTTSTTLDNGQKDIVYHYQYYIGQWTGWTCHNTTSTYWTMDRMDMLYPYQYYIGQWTEWTCYMSENMSKPENLSTRQSWVTKLTFFYFSLLIYHTVDGATGFLIWVMIDGCVRVLKISWFVFRFKV